MMDEEIRGSYMTPRVCPFSRPFSDRYLCSLHCQPGPEDGHGSFVSVLVWGRACLIARCNAKGFGRCCSVLFFLLSERIDYSQARERKGNMEMKSCTCIYDSDQNFR